MKRIPTLLWIFVAVFCFAALLHAAFPRVPSGTWAPAENLATARANASAVLLPDGRILITGGMDAAGQPLASAELFNTDGSFSAAAPMNAARSGHLAVMLSDGDVLVAGGTTTGGGVTNSAELYDLNADRWTTLSATMLDARTGATAAQLLDGDLLIAGGQDANGVPLASLERFVLTQGYFTHAGVLVAARKDAAAAVLNDGRVLIAGGTTADANGTSTLGTTEIYDPATGSVSAGPDLVTARAGHSATTLLDGTVLIVGGNNPEGAQNGGPAELASAELYDPAGGTVTATASLATARTGHQAFLLPNNNNVLIVGGSAAGTALASAELYTPWTHEFHTTAAMASARAGATGAALYNPSIKTGTDGLLLVAGGKNDTGTLASGELYGFATVKTDQVDYAPGTVVTITGSGWQSGETVTLTLLESPLIDTPPTMTAVADANGNIFNDQFSPDIYDINVRFYLNAVGSQSGFQAQNTFTDAPGDNTSTAVTCSPNPVTVNTATTCTATVNNTQNGAPNGFPQGDVAFQLNSQPAGSCTLTQLSANSSKCSVNVTPVATGTALVKGNFNPPNPPNNNWKPSTSSNFSLTVTAPTDTTPPVITPNVVGALGNNGWYTSNVAVSWTVTDPESSIASSSGCGTTNITADTVGTALTCTATSAGGTSSQSVTIKRDATSPSGVSGAASRAADHNGWYTSAVTINFSGTDAISGIASCTSTPYSGTDSATASITGHCTDNAGNSSADVAFDFKYDATAPTAVALSVTAGTAGANGWYTSDVTVHTSGTELVSGPPTCTADQLQTAETTGQVFNGSCTNDAGLTANAAPLTVKLDKTGPTATLAVTAGTLGANGWYTSDVTVHASGTDTISGPVSCGSDQSISTETTGTPVNGSCTNDAGLSTNAAPLTIKLDKTAPLVTLAVTAGTAGTNGWYTSDVTVRTSGTETISNPISCVADQFQTSETTGVAFDGSCTNDAGLTGHATPLAVKLDKTGPTATLAVSAGTLGDHGWYVSDVTVHASGTDTISSPVTCSADQFLTTDSTGHIFSASCANDAGLSTNATDLTVKLDKTPPTVHITPDRGADHNGWYNHSLSFTNPGTDSTSEIASCTTPTAYSGPDSAATSVSASCKDNAGNTGNGSFTFQYDATAPTNVVGEPNRAMDYNGWYNHAVDVAFSGIDAISGIDSCSTVNYSGSDTANASVNGTCTDKAGNTSAPVASSSFKFDSTPPTAALAVTVGTPGANGWYTSNVTVGTSGTDTVSNPTVCSADQFQAVETTGTAFAGECTNDAGLSTNAAPLSVKLDKTAPTAVTLTPAGTLGKDNWYVNNVTIHTSGDENVSTPIVCTLDQFQATDTTGQVFHGSCTNNAGLSANASDITIKRDATPPVLSGSRTPGPNAYGWNNVDVTANFSCSDATSGVDVAPVTPQVVSAEGAGQSRSADCSDLAGNSSHATVDNVNIDKTPPTLAFGGPSPGPNVNGWNKTDVSFSYTPGDVLSGVDTTLTPAGPLVLSAEGSAVTGNVTVTDKAGNSMTFTSPTVKIDKTAPIVNGSRIPLANANGWNNTDVTVSFACTDSLSGMDVAPVTPQVISTEGADQSRSASCTDAAGNSSNFNVDHINIDKTNPTITLTISPASPAATGWYNISTGRPTVSFACGDSLSGVASCASPVLVGEGTNQTISGSAMDKAGNSASTSIMHVNVDVTAPTINLVNPANGGSYLLNQLANANYSCADTGSSGLVAGSAGCGGPVTTGSQYDTASVGSKNFTVNAKDVAGNTASQTNAYGVFYSTGSCLGDLGHQILQPINSDGTSVFKQKSTVPAKFRVCDANGNSIGTPGVVASFRLVQIISGTVVNTVDEAVDSTTPDTAFRWDPTGQQWIYNISTKSAPVNIANVTYVFQILLNDGSKIQFQLGLK